MTESFILEQHGPPIWQQLLWMYQDQGQQELTLLSTSTRTY